MGTSLLTKTRITAQWLRLGGALLAHLAFTTLLATEIRLIDTPGIGDCLPPSQTANNLRSLHLPEWATKGEAESATWTQTGMQWLTLLAWDEADRAFHEAERLARNSWATWGRGFCRMHEPAFAEAFFQEALRISETNGTPEEKSFFIAWTTFNKAQKANTPAADCLHTLAEHLSGIQTKPEGTKCLFTLDVLARMNTLGDGGVISIAEARNRLTGVNFTPKEAGWIQFHWMELRAGKPFKAQEFMTHATLAATPAVWRWAALDPSTVQNAWFLEATVRQRFSNLKAKPMHLTYAQSAIVAEATTLLPSLRSEQQTELQSTLDWFPSYPATNKQDVKKLVLPTKSIPSQPPISFPPLKSIGPLSWKNPAIPDELKKQITEQTNGKQWQLINVYIDHNCPRCMAQLTELAKLAEEFSSESCAITCVGGDTAEEVGLAKPVGGVMDKFPFPLIADPEHKITTQLGCFDYFSKLPLHGTFLYDENLQLRWWIAGDMPFESISFLLNELKVCRSKSR